MHMLATPDHEAYFDFCSNVIQLKVYDSSYQDEFQRAISWESCDPTARLISGHFSSMK